MQETSESYGSGSGEPCARTEQRALKRKRSASDEQSSGLACHRMHSGPASCHTAYIESKTLLLIQLMKDDFMYWLPCSCLHV